MPHNIYRQEEGIVARRIVCAFFSIADEAVEVVDQGFRDGYLVGEILWQPKDLFQTIGQFEFSGPQNLKVTQLFPFR